MGESKKAKITIPYSEPKKKILYKAGVEKLRLLKGEKNVK